ncbi:MAG: hypothetical protein APF83_02885 [Lutibacter sp. BRH_c52]|nr:MAG: hypothetical protein APF83_02885 [Lutibacter sp. BRH_c52]
MKVNNIKNISKTINLLDKRITELLLQNEIDEDKIDTLSSIRFQYVEELNSLIRVKNTRDMFNKKNN